MTELAAASPVGANKLLFNPSLAGGSSQEPSPHIRGRVRGHRPAPHPGRPRAGRHGRDRDEPRGRAGGAAPLRAALGRDAHGGRGEQEQALAPDLRRRLRHGLREDQRRPGGGVPGRRGRCGRGRGALEGLREGRRGPPGGGRARSRSRATWRNTAGWCRRSSCCGRTRRSSASCSTESRSERGRNSMKIGLFTATYLDTKLEEVCTMAAGLGYQAVELPAFAGNPHLDIEEIVKGSNAKALLKMLNAHGLIISALANHPEGQIVLGPYGKDTDAICKGTKEEKIRFGTERMIKTAQAANALGVPVVTGLHRLRELRTLLPLALLEGLGGHGAGVRGALGEDPGQVRGVRGEVRPRAAPQRAGLRRGHRAARRGAAGRQEGVRVQLRPGQPHLPRHQRGELHRPAQGPHLPRARQGRRGGGAQREALGPHPPGRLAAARAAGSASASPAGARCPGGRSSRSCP